jgi:hypothetical protein
MLTKCECNHCSERIEFEAENSGETVACPHCGMETVLLIPKRRLSLQKIERHPRHGNSLIWIIVGGVVTALLVAALIYWIVPVVQMLLPAAGAIMVLTLTLAVSLLMFILGVIWIVFPVFVYFQLRRTIQLLTAIESNTRPALRIQNPADQSPAASSRVT